MKLMLFVLADSGLLCLQILLALLLNAGLLWMVVRWLRQLRQEPRVGGWVMPTLALKLVATAISVFFISEDALLFQLWAGRMTQQLWLAPMAWLQMLGQDTFSMGRWHLVYHGFSNTLFLMKVLSVLNLASGGWRGLNALYLSLFSFWGGWTLVRAVARLWPAARPGGVVIGFLLWPTVVYWTSGLTKESLLVGSGAALLAWVLRLCYAPATVRGRWGWWLMLPLLVWLHFKMRFFFAAVLLGALAGLGLIRVVQRLGGARYRPTQVLLLLGLLSAGAWAASEVSPVFRLNKFTSQLQRNYSELLETSRNRPHLEYPTLTPTTESVLQNAPAAIANAVTRPWPWEGGGLYSIAGLENVLLFGLLLLALGAAVRGRSGQLPFALTLALLVYCLLLAALLGLSTPNMGTLNRYRVAFLPFLVLLLTQNDYFCGLLQRLKRLQIPR